MKRLVVWLAIGSVLGVLGMLACGPGSEKPPLTPDNVETADDAGPG